MDKLIYSTNAAGRAATPATLRPLPAIIRRAPLLPRLTPPALLHCNGFKPVVASLFTKHGDHRTPTAAVSDTAEISCFTACYDRENGVETLPAAPLTGGRELAGSAIQKVIRSAVVVILSAIVLTIIQPIVAPPSYATVQAAAKSGGKLIQTELLTSAWTGFFAGCLHTLSGPDHLAALAPLSIGRTRIESALVGALWGCGHDAGQVIFGLLFLILKDRLHIEIIRTWGTRVVGLTLLVIGAMGIREASEVPAPCVVLENGECVADHIEALPTGKKKVGFATFATGIVHGLQPDALMMVLPALALPSRVAGAAFLGMFLVGTVFAMGSYTVFIGSCTQALKERVPRITEKLTWAASLIAISMGLGIIISQFFGFSLY